MTQNSGSFGPLDKFEKVNKLLGLNLYLTSLLNIFAGYILSSILIGSITVLFICNDKIKIERSQVVWNLIYEAINW